MKRKIAQSNYRNKTEINNVIFMGNSIEKKSEISLQNFTFIKAKKKCHHLPIEQ